MLRFSRAAMIMAFCLSVAGCIVSSGKLFETATGARPLPQEFVVHFKSEEDASGGRVTLAGDVYTLHDADSTMRVRFFPLETKGIRAGMYVVEVSDKGDANQYALAEIGGNELTAYGFDAGPRAAALKVPAEIGEYATRFSSAGDLLKVMAATAASLPENADAVISDPLGNIRVAEMEIYDFADPARKAKGEALLLELAKKALAEEN